MKRQKHHHSHFPGRALCASMALGLALLAPQAAFCADSVPADIYEAQSDLNAAQGDLRQAERNFGQAGKMVDEGTSAQTTWSQIQEPQPLQKAEPESAQKPAPRMPKKYPRASVSQNVAPGYDGYMGTYVDPANGDIVTSVIAPKRQQNDDYANYPIIIEPLVGDWNNGGSNWNNGWNAGWGGPGWHGPGQQVPGYPYPPSWPGFSPSGQVPGYPYPPANPGYGPPPPPPPGYWPGMPPGPSPDFKPNWPGTRPPGPDFKPDWPGQNRPPKPGGNTPGGIFPPDVPPPAPGFGPGQGPAINPGRPPRPGSGPGYPPSMPPRPGFGPGPGPGFGPGSHPGFGPGQGPGFRPGFRPGHGPGFRPGFGHGPGFGPRSELTPPKNPDRRGSLPLVAPNFPPKVHQQPFVNLYHAPEVSAPGLHAGGAEERKIPASRTYFVPGSAQSWEASNWQAGKGGM